MITDVADMKLKSRKKLDNNDHKLLPTFLLF